MYFIELKEERYNSYWYLSNLHRLIGRNVEVYKKIFSINFKSSDQTTSRRLGALNLALRRILLNIKQS